jgi:hypothetical protein
MLPTGAVQFNPGFGSSYMLLAAPLAKLGRHDEAKAAVARLMEREPAFRLSRQFAGVERHWDTGITFLVELA